MQVNILGIRGIPAQHGGFETFAARLAPYLTRRGHQVLVYCQAETGPVRQWHQDEWHGIMRRHFRPRLSGAAATMDFDLAAARDVTGQPGVDLVLGYNTAVFNIGQRIRRRRVLMNMDGIEWKRAKWSAPAKLWFFLNEVIGANISSQAIADHPEIQRHVARRCFKTPVMIPYGAEQVTKADAKYVQDLGLTPDNYLISIARIEPENSILELVRAFSTTQSGADCVILGNLDPDNDYHRRVRAAAGPSVRFPGAIYDPPAVAALRFHCRAYLHGHQVGGTNPSLVEALGAGNAVIAHDNRFNRWVAGEGQFYFADSAGCADQMRGVLADTARVEAARKSARARHEARFLWDRVLSEYERLICGQ